VSTARTSSAFCFISAVLIAQSCPPQGMTLAADGSKLGDPWSIAIAGPPSTSGLLGLDIDGGPTPTAIGPICLGLTPSLVMWPITLDASGQLQLFGIVPADPALANVTLYTQAFVFAPSTPSGFALSNGASVTLRAPRLYFFNSGVTSPFGNTAGAVAAVGVLTDTTPFNQPLASSLRDLAFVKKREAVAMLLGNGNAAGFDSVTGAARFTTSFPASPSNPSEIAAADNGLDLLVMATGSFPNPFGGGSPGGFHVISVPATPGPAPIVQTVTLPSGNCDAILPFAGTSLVFLRQPTAVVAVDLVGSFVYPAIPVNGSHGGLVDWRFEGGYLYVLHAGTTPGPFGGGGSTPRLTVIDPNLQTVVASVTLGFAAPAQWIRGGPGSTGPSIYVGSAFASSIFEHAQFTLAPTGSIPTGSGITAFELSALGSEWLYLCNGAACGGSALWAMPAGSLTPSVVLAPLPPGVQPLIAVPASATFGKAYLIDGTSTAAPFLTDPSSPPYATITLPITSSSFRYVGN
jgi:hypothetical protein